MMYSRALAFAHHRRARERWTLMVPYSVKAPVTDLLERVVSRSCHERKEEGRDEVVSIRKSILSIYIFYAVHWLLHTYIYICICSIHILNKLIIISYYYLNLKEQRERERKETLNIDVLKKSMSIQSRRMSCVGCTDHRGCRWWWEIVCCALMTSLTSSSAYPSWVIPYYICALRIRVADTRLRTTTTTKTNTDPAHSGTTSFLFFSKAP